MANHCAGCRSTDVVTGIDGYTCSICGAYTVDGEVVRKEYTTTVVETRPDAGQSALSVVLVVALVLALLWAFGVIPK